MRGAVLTRRDDDGFTLVELLISVVVLGILLVAVSAATMAVLRTTGSTDVRLTESRAQQFAAAYFSADAHGATTVSTGGAPRCGSDPTAVVEFIGQDFDDALTVTTKVVTYVVRTASGADGAAGRELRRLICTASTATPAYPLTPTREVTVARELAESAPTSVTCSATSCATVQLTVRTRSGDLEFTLTGHRRTT